MRGAGAAGPLRLPPSTNLSHPEEPPIRTGEPIAEPPGSQELVCPNSNGLALVSLSSGNVVPLRCRRLTCQVCVLINARRRSLAISYARPERAILLTDAGPEYSVIQARMNRVRYDIGQETGRPFEWLWHVEPNPSGDGKHHVHAWSHGSYVAQRRLSAIAARRGMGSFARINRIRSTTGASHYGLKGLGYGLKSIEHQETVAGYLRTNGRRLTHQSRGYFRSEDGAKIGARTAEDLALGATRSRDPGPWQLTSL